jgi:hypothetical protein
MQTSNRKLTCEINLNPALSLFEQIETIFREKLTLKTEKANLRDRVSASPIDHVFAHTRIVQEHTLLGCLVLRALHRRDKCVKCHAKLSDLKRSVYRIERVVDSWRTKVDPLGGKVHRAQQPAPRRVRRHRDQRQAFAAVLA